MSETEFILSSRRGFLGGLLALVAAPAIVRASSLMPVKVLPPKEVLDGLFVDEVYPVTENTLLTVRQITREAIRLWKNSNLYMENIEGEYGRVFGPDDVKIGTRLRIRQPLEQQMADRIPDALRQNFAFRS
jgi:hypothetical protein